MTCKHERLCTVGFNWFCADCGAALTPEQALGEQKQPKNPPADEKTGKPTPKKTTARKTAKKG